MDVNGLKRENDTYGHAAGDEFTVIIKEKTDQNFRKLLHDEAESHICKTGTKLSISVGEADTKDSDSILDIMHLADTRMYDEKNEYYRLSGDKR